MFINDRQIVISEGNSRRAAKWNTCTYYWSELVERLQTPARGTETYEEYMRMSKSQQDDLKDVGGFVAGTLRDGRRKASAVTGRDLITLDLDHIPAGGTDDVLRRVDGLSCGYCVYSTRKHQPAAPRLRVLLPLDRTVTADEYEPIARMAAKLIGIEMCDPSTFEPSRLMYWPSCCADAQYVYTFADKPFLSADGMLALYPDWHDINAWPQVPGVTDNHKRLAAKQGDPTTKPGVVGAFCRVYNIYAAMDKFLPGIYVPTDKPDRYTYAAGSTTGGAIVYDNGTFLYSHHATDPAGGRLCNAFDLVRLHLFSDKDDDAKPDTPINRLSSYMEMCKLAAADPDVAALLNKERYDKATVEFGELSKADGEPESWMNKLQTTATGIIQKTTKNIRLCLENDPRLKDRIKLDTFADRLIGIAPLPWGSREKESGPFEWQDTDDAGIRDYIQQIIGIKSADLVSDAVILVAQKHAYNPVAEYLESLTWDGQPRLDTLYIDYLGAEDCPYTRAICRKAFTAAVARAMKPGTKFDYMTVVSGPQGIGKTTLFAKMGMQWFSNSLVTFEGKEAAEILQGAWIIEIGELEAYSKSDIRLIKQFLSKTDDQYRAAYARRTEHHPRRCIFFGTTNDFEYLRDPTGNRRFWPVDATSDKHRLNVFNDLTPDIVDQIWAEAVVRYRLGEPLVLSEEMELEAERRRSAHTERDPLEGQIEAFLEKPVPEDWQSWDCTRRMMYWSGSMRADIPTVPRDRICAAEIWKECLGNRIPMTKTDARRINEILSKLEEWEPCGIQRFGDEYGRQRGFKRKISVNILPKSCQHFSGSSTNGNKWLSTLSTNKIENVDSKC